MVTGRRNHVAAGVTALLALQVVTTYAVRDVQWVNGPLLFWIVVIAASLCVVSSLALVTVAHHNRQAELGLVGTFFAAISAMAVVHGLTTPGVLYDGNSATAASVFWGVPVGLVAMAPSLLRSTPVGRALGRRWTAWSSLVLTGVAGLCALMLLAPNAVWVPEMGSPLAVAGALTWAAAAVSLGWRHVRLAEVAQRNGPLVVTFGFALVAASVLVFLSGPMFAPHFWLAHALDITGVFLATIGGVVVYLREGDTRAVLAPVVAIDAHSALEVGLSPVVHAFIADLDAKDEMTRDHVIRSGALAIDVALELGLPAAEVRKAGLVGLLHDVGKLTIPDEILTKPGALDDDEFAIMRSHAAAGAQMLLDAPGLDDLAPLVRSHHERVDGGGYPSGLAGEEIPLIARIVSACDAFDAITVTRHYRSGRPIETAHEILRANAGTQWDPRVVDALITHTGKPGFVVGTPTALDRVGEGHEAEHRIGCDCVHELVG